MSFFHQPRRFRSARTYGRVALLATSALAVAACGGTSSGATTAPAATTTPTANATATPVPVAGAQLTNAGEVQLEATVAPAGITCSWPSLDGPEITIAVQSVDKSAGGFVTISASEVFVRVGAGSGTAYTQRNFAGPGVTAYNAATGATFNATLTDTSSPGQHKGTIGSITSIAGSVACGTQTPGSGDITIDGTSTGGAISGTLTSIHVNCDNAPNFALINALTKVGSSAATVEIGGGGGEAYFASFATSSGSLYFSSSKPGLYTISNGQVHWSAAVLTESGAAGDSVTVNGDATCGTS